MNTNHPTQLRKRQPHGRQWLAAALGTAALAMICISRSQAAPIIATATVTYVNSANANVLWDSTTGTYPPNVPVTWSTDPSLPGTTLGGGDEATLTINVSGGNASNIYVAPVAATTALTLKSVIINLNQSGQNYNLYLGKEVGQAQNAITWDSGQVGVPATLTLNGKWRTKATSTMILNSDLNATIVNGGGNREAGFYSLVSGGAGKLSITCLNSQPTTQPFLLGTGSTPNGYTGGTSLKGKSDLTTNYYVLKAGVFGTGPLALEAVPLNLNSFSQTVGGLADGAGGSNGSSISDQTGSAGPTTLTLDFPSTAGPFTFSGVIKNGSAAIPRVLALTKQGTGTQILGGANTYTGATMIKNGTLALGTGNDRLPASTTVTLGDGTTNDSGILKLDSRSQQLAGLLTAGAGTGNRVVNGNATAATLTLNIATGTNTFGGALGGPGTDENNFALTKSGTGTLTLGGSNTYAGPTTVAAGTLACATAAALAATALEIDALATVDLGYSGTRTIPSLKIGGSAMPNGTYGSAASGAPLPDAHFTGPGTVTVASAPSSPYASWIAGYYPTPGDPRAAHDADPDGDGHNNLTEFAFKGVPNDGSNSGLFFTTTKDNNADTLKELTFTCAVRRSTSVSFAANGDGTQTATIDGVIYAIEGSATLAGPWASPVAFIGKSDAAPTGSGLGSLAGTDWEYCTFSAFNGIPDKGFLRARTAPAP
ncbi:MAG: autotransporter-associated beta strand repeat-containing protein [Verrucomicrobia bacterium]|nr:autotransporter-associated beta strand repeat-containing protein [Verrucomicrobiota bacterium]